MRSSPPILGGVSAVSQRKPNRGSLDRRVAELARRQHSAFSHSQALALGATEGDVRYRLLVGRWLWLQQSVYGIAGVPPSWQRDLTAALLAVDGHGVASHRSAARLWGFGASDEVVEVTVARNHQPLHDGVIVHRLADLFPHAIGRRRGFRVTKPARTIVDLGAVLPVFMVQRALDEALSMRLTTWDGLERAVLSVARRGRAGVGAVRELLLERCPEPKEVLSVLERLANRMVRDYHLARPELQYNVVENGHFLGRPDFVWAAARLAVEVDGYRAHSSLEAFQRDRTRQNALVRAGWRVLRYTWYDIKHRPEAVAAEIAAELGWVSAA